MDSLTQLVLGATVGEAVLGRKVGRRALAWGALAGTMPDFDVLVYPLWNDLERLVLHRGFTHSFLVLTVAAPLLALLPTRLHRQTGASWRDWTLLMFLSLITHPMLDCLTTYGTQIAWPFSQYPYAWSSVFIVDPLYTLPLIFATVTGLRAGADPPTRRRIVCGALLLSTSYLGITLFNKASAERVFREALAQHGKEGPHGDGVLRGDGELLTMAGMFNNVLWRALYLEDDVVYESFYSFLGDKAEIRFSATPRGAALRDEIGAHPSLQRLITFSKGYYTLHREGDQIVYTDLRFGSRNFYVFTYEVNPVDRPLDEQIVRRPRPDPAPHALKHLWLRIKGVPYDRMPDEATAAAVD